MKLTKRDRMVLAAKLCNERIYQRVSLFKDMQTDNHATSQLNDLRQDIKRELEFIISRSDVKDFIKLVFYSPDTDYLDTITNIYLSDYKTANKLHLAMVSDYQVIYSLNLA